MPNPPKPHAMKVVAGTARADRQEPPTVPEYDLVSEFPDPPQHLTPDGAEMWRNTGPQLVRAGVLQVVDMSQLEQLCFAWQQFRKKAKADMDVTASEHNALMALFTQFGMSPASRRRVMGKVDDSKPANRFAKYGTSGK